MLKIKVIRDEFSPTYTTGRLYINGKFFGYTLEDTVRADGAKVDGMTAIPAGVYPITVSLSPKFGRMMPLIENVPGYTGIRIHQGNTAAHTRGCLLVGYERIKKGGRINNSLQAERDLTALLLANQQAGKTAKISIENRYVKRGVLFASIGCLLIWTYNQITN
jgi:hypothetical protein